MIRYKDGKESAPIEIQNSQLGIFTQAVFKTIEKDKDEVGRLGWKYSEVVNPLLGFVLHGSRGRGDALIDSDWDGLFITRSEPIRRPSAYVDDIRSFLTKNIRGHKIEILGSILTVPQLIIEQEDINFFAKSKGPVVAVVITPDLDLKRQMEAVLKANRINIRNIS